MDRSRWFWLPALVTALFASPVVAVGALVLAGALGDGAIVLGLAGAAGLTWVVARWQRARGWEAAALAVIAVGVGLWALVSVFSGLQ